MVSQLEEVAEEVADSLKNSMHAGLEDVAKKVADSLKNSMHAGLAIHSIDAWICFS